jgi:hypothetical protein
MFDIVIEGAIGAGKTELVKSLVAEIHRRNIRVPRVQNTTGINIHWRMSAVWLACAAVIYASGAPTEMVAACLIISVVACASASASANASANASATASASANASASSKIIHAVPVFEPVDQWLESGAFADYKKDPVKNAVKFQAYARSTRILEARRVHAAVAPADRARTIFVHERCPVSDDIFMELHRGEVPNVDMLIYDSWRESFAPAYPFDLSAATVLYLDPDLEVCMQRLTARARIGEVVDAEKDSVGVSAEYQGRLRRAHEALLLGKHADEFPQLASREPLYPRKSVIVVPSTVANLNFRDPGPERERVLDALLALVLARV